MHINLNKYEETIVFQKKKMIEIIKHKKIKNTFIIMNMISFLKKEKMHGASTRDKGGCGKTVTFSDFKSSFKHI